ncbi:MAG: hypothetical protein UIG59_03490 [Acutalibacteraceae bacterium]|nr:hypothetical protein [Acutalibacteraceae bacterium]
MEELTREEFLRRRAQAEMDMKRLYGGKNMPPYPGFVTVSEDGKQKKENKTDDNALPHPAVNPPITPEKMPKTDRKNPSEIFRFINLPELIKSPDGMLILGLIFLLLCDNADELLIMALVFIML